MRHCLNQKQLFRFFLALVQVVLCGCSTPTYEERFAPAAEQLEFGLGIAAAASAVARSAVYAVKNERQKKIEEGDVEALRLAVKEAELIAAISTYRIFVLKPAKQQPDPDNRLFVLWSSTTHGNHGSAGGLHSEPMSTGLETPIGFRYESQILLDIIAYERKLKPSLAAAIFGSLINAFDAH